MQNALLIIFLLQSAVRAAIEGRVLVLEGVEKAERNVLPVLNNLLENREMQLEDGRLLIASSRYDKLLQVFFYLLYINLRLKASGGLSYGSFVFSFTFSFFLFIYQVCSDHFIYMIFFYLVLSCVCVPTLEP